MTKTEVIASVAGDLNATEQAVDQAIARATTLVQSMIGARAALSLSPVAAAEAQSKALEAISALGVARQTIVACHSELAKDHRRLGFGVYMDGWQGKPEEQRLQATGEQRLRAV